MAACGGRGPAGLRAVLGGVSNGGGCAPRPSGCRSARRAQGHCSLRRASTHRSCSASGPYPSPLSCCPQSLRPAGPARCSALAALRAAFLFFLFSPPLPTLSDPDTSWPNATAMLQGHMGISPTVGSLTTPLHLQSPAPPPPPWDPAASLCFGTFLRFARSPPPLLLGDPP